MTSEHWALANANDLARGKNNDGRLTDVDEQVVDEQVDDEQVVDEQDVDEQEDDQVDWLE